MGELALAHTHLEQGLALYDPYQHHAHAFLYGHDPGVFCLIHLAGVLWHLGYPDQARKREHEALTLAKELEHPFDLAAALFVSAIISYQYCREEAVMRERIEGMKKISTEHGFSGCLVVGNLLQAWVLAEHGQVEEGISHMRQCLAATLAMGAELLLPYWLLLRAEAHGKGEQIEEGFGVLAEALAIVNKTGERSYEAELYRLKGEFTLQFKVQGSKFKVANPQMEAEACFVKAIEVARKQQTKLLELRAVTSLSRLWQRQGKKNEARQMLSEIYGWFTEGFDTKDLQEAKELLEELTQ